MSGIQKIAVNGNNVFAADLGYNYVLYRSKDNGNSWDQVTPPGSGAIGCVAASNSTVFIMDESSTIYSSTDSGNTWKTMTMNNLIGAIEVFSVNGNSLFVGTNSGVFLSTDAGNNFSSCGNVPSGFSLTINNSILYAGTNSTSGIYFSINNGTTWKSIGPTISTNLYNSINSISASGTKIIATTGSDNFFYYTPNNGTNWTKPDVLGQLKYSSIINGNYMLIGTDAGIFRSPLP